MIDPVVTGFWKRLLVGAVLLAVVVGILLMVSSMIGG